MPRKKIRRIEKTENVTIRLPEGVMEQVRAICDSDGYSIAAFMRVAVEFYLRDLQLRRQYSGFVGSTEQRSEISPRSDVSPELLDRTVEALLKDKRLLKSLETEFKKRSHNGELELP